MLWGQWFGTRTGAPSPSPHCARCWKLTRFRACVVWLLSHASRARYSLLFLPLGDRRADQVAPLRPRAVVVLHVLEAQQILEHEPGMARALADAAVGDDRWGV